MALLNKGGICRQLGRLEEAANICDEIANRFGKVDEPTIRALVAQALNNKSGLLYELNRKKEAIEVCDEFVRTYGDSTEHGILLQVVIRLNE